MTEEIALQQYTHSLKLEETAKGVRISVHVYGNNDQDTIKDAVETYIATREQLDKKEIPLAPMEVK